jgi:hypothetical protein
MTVSADNIIGGIGALSFVAAAVLWLWASLIKVPDNIDTFVSELQRISRVNAWAAFATMIGTVCATIIFVRQLQRMMAASIRYSR